ncbi:hypothetical protein KU75_25285 [Pectobacterium odoriferum]|uniref:Uncharacterized protein n=1 Tax=Pectobacterium odoriferum TaxID=78398 RepID=A0ABR4VI50_9GAMM|nr:hypothetical protein [Pectobacterium carotovorum]KGA39006.1 hypothetical protein KU75_25285 [Pectobacterium odoriferum]MCL6399141.1 hypothetical protein [Pectobacterium carotovorum subsp. carotovorum]
MPIFRESGGSFAPVKRIDINDAGVIKRVAAAWIVDEGVFKKLFPTEPVDMADSDIFDIEKTAIDWGAGGSVNEKYWSFNFAILAAAGISLKRTVSSRVTVKIGGAAQVVRYLVGGWGGAETRADGIADNAVSVHPGDPTSLRLGWQQEFRAIHILYDQALVGSVTDIRIELTDASGGSYFYDTSATLIAI